MDNLNPEFKKFLSSPFWKNAIWSFLPSKAGSDLRAKSLNKVPFKAFDCQDATDMWLSIEALRKKMPLVLLNFPSLPQEWQKTYLYYKISIIYLKWVFRPSWGKEGKFTNTNSFFFLKSYMENHIKVAFWQSDALNGTLFSEFALKSDSAL